MFVKFNPLSLNQALHLHILKPVRLGDRKCWTPPIYKSARRHILYSCLKFDGIIRKLILGLIIIHMKGKEYEITVTVALRQNYTM